MTTRHKTSITTDVRFDKLLDFHAQRLGLLGRSEAVRYAVHALDLEKATESLDHEALKKAVENAFENDDDFANWLFEFLYRHARAWWKNSKGK